MEFMIPIRDMCPFVWFLFLVWVGPDCFYPTECNERDRLYVIMCTWLCVIACNVHLAYRPSSLVVLKKQAARLWASLWQGLRNSAPKPTRKWMQPMTMWAWMWILSLLSLKGEPSPDITVIAVVQRTQLREGNGNPLQYSCLENSMNRRAWQATVHGVKKS